MKKMIAVLLMVCMVPFSLSACGKADSKQGQSEQLQQEEAADAVAEEKAGDEIKIGVLLKTEANEYWATMKKGIEEWAEGQEGVTVDILCADSENNTSGQLEQMENMISKDYDALCVAPLSASNLISGVAKAVEEGIPVIDVDEAMDQEALKEAGTSVVGIYTTDNETLGANAAEYIVNVIGEGGKVAIVEGTAGNINSINRATGAKNYFEDHGLEVVASQPADWDRLTAIDVATNIMQSNPDIQAFYCCNDTMALGVQEAVINAGKQNDIVVVGTDGLKNAYESIKNGEMAATVAQDNVGIGIACCEKAVQAVQEGWTADPSAEIPVNYIDSFLVTKDNVDQYLK